MEIFDFLTKNAEELGLAKEHIYKDYPIYKDLDQKTIVVPTAVVSPMHGIVIITSSEDRNNSDFEQNKESYKENLDEIYRLLYSKLVKNPVLSTGRNAISIPITTVVYVPNIIAERKAEGEVVYVYNEIQLKGLFCELKQTIGKNVFDETVAIIEGSKGLLLQKERKVIDTSTKGYAVNVLEKEIRKFDEQQKTAFFSDIEGLSRIRGLAGSGKTVILCMKAALLHLKEPEAVIVFTFYTKSLYQHIRRLITRFYRQFDDKDPNWDNLLVMHAWGNDMQTGVYRMSCNRHGVPAISFQDAQIRSRQPFDFVCSSFLDQVKEYHPLFDYMLIDEGQDFPASFLKLSANIVRGSRVVYAYDDLQTIFQRKAPTAADIFGTDDTGKAIRSFTMDRILYKCYRNPLPVIVVAHAIGFGIYASCIAQMIEADYWKDIGYEIEEGAFEPGDRMVIKRPDKNSQTFLDKQFGVNEIIRTKNHKTFMEEVDFVCSAILNDIKKDGLHPDDILVVSVDDRNATSYLNTMEKRLKQFGIESNNIHADKFSITDFQQEGKVTLSTIHKAKGNEAYSVYIMGVDALFPYQRNVRERNLLFTAMTRSKGWLTITGIGPNAESWINEIETAKKNVPYLLFNYPTRAQLKMMPRDMDEANDIANQREQLAQDLLKTMTIEQAIDFFEQKKNKKH